MSFAKVIAVIVAVAVLSSCEASRKTAPVEGIPNADGALARREAYVDKYNGRLIEIRRATYLLKELWEKLNVALGRDKNSKTPGYTPVDFLMEAVDKLRHFSSGVTNETGLADASESTQILDLSKYGYKGECAPHFLKMRLDPNTNSLTASLTGCATEGKELWLYGNEWADGGSSALKYNHELVGKIAQQSRDDLKNAEAELREKFDNSELAKCEVRDAKINCREMVIPYKEVSLNIVELTYQKTSDPLLTVIYKLSSEEKTWEVQLTRKGLKKREVVSN